MVVETQVAERVASATFVFENSWLYSDALDAIDVVDHLWRRINGLQAPRSLVSAATSRLSYMRSGKEIQLTTTAGFELKLVRLRFESPVLETLTALGGQVTPFACLVLLMHYPRRIGSFLGDLKSAYHESQDHAAEARHQRKLNDERRKGAQVRYAETGYPAERIDDSVARRALDLQPRAVDVQGDAAFSDSLNQADETLAEAVRTAAKKYGSLRSSLGESR